MLGGLFFGIYSIIFQKKTEFQDKRFADFQLSLPHEKIFGNIVPQTFKEYLAGVLLTIISFFPLFQGFTIIYRQEMYSGKEMYGSPNSIGAEVATVFGVLGIFFGAILASMAQYRRHVNRIGTLTLNNMLFIGISFFLSFQPDQTAGAIMLLIELILICVPWIIMAD